MLHTKNVEIGPPVPEKKIVCGLYHIWSCRPSWSCDLDHLIKLLVPFLSVLHMKFGFDWPSGFRGEDL